MYFMNLNGLNLKNNIQTPVQVTRNNVSNAINPTAPTQIDPEPVEGDISSAASNPIGNTNQTQAAEALKAQMLAQAPVSYRYIRDIKLPFSDNAKLFQLANGQKVVILEKKGPTVLETYYNVGSMNEPDDQRGISHFNEHMAFNGSKGPSGKTLEAGDFFKIVNEMGAMTNASTGFSQTDYFISSQLLGDNVFEKSAFIQSQQLQYPEHTSEMVEKEKGPVTSEISMVGDQPENMALNNCIRNLFQIESTSPDLVAGTINNINNLNRDKTLDYYNLWYTPDNCSTVVTGEVSTQEAMDTIARHFNKFSSAPIHNRKYQDFNTINKPVRVDVKLPKAQSSIMALGFAGPSNNSTKENIIMELLMTSMLGYKNARISRELNKIQSAAMMNIERVGNRPTDPKAIMIVSQATPEKTENVIKTIYSEINRLTQTPLTKEELDTSKKILKMTFSKISENSHLLNTLIGNALLDDDLPYIENYLSILETITPEDVTKFAQKYLDLNKASLSVVHPQNLDDNAIMANYQKANKKFEHVSVPNSKLTNSVKPAFGAKITPKVSFKGRIEEKSFDLSKIKEYKLANNMEIVLNPNNSDITTSKITLRTETPANIKPSVPAILGVILNEGSKNKNYDLFYKDIHKVGAALKFDADFQSISANVESLKGDTAMTLDLVKEVFNEPRFNEKSLDYAKKLIKEAVSNADNNASEKALKELFPTLPEFSTKKEMYDSIDTVTLDEIKSFYEYLKNNSMAKGVFTAPIEKNPELEKTIIEKMSLGLDTFKTYNKEIFQSFSPIGKDVVVTKTEPRNQADIVQAFKFKTNYNPKDHAAFRVLNTILGDGSSSRLFNDLREKQKLAYRVESNLDFVGNTGLIMLGIKTTTDDKTAGVQQFDNVQKSLNGFKKHIEMLKNEQVSKEELDAAKLRIKTKLLNSMESSDSQTTVLDNSKDSILGISTLNENLKLIESITAADVQNAARYIFEGNSVTSILASEDTIKDFEKSKDIIEAQKTAAA